MTENHKSIALSLSDLKQEHLLVAQRFTAAAVAFTDFVNTHAAELDIVRTAHNLSGAGLINIQFIYACQCGMLFEQMSILQMTPIAPWIPPQGAQCFADWRVMLSQINAYLQGIRKFMRDTEMI